jgi:hypothetical protein
MYLIAVVSCLRQYRSKYGSQFTATCYYLPNVVVLILWFIAPQYFLGREHFSKTVTSMQCFNGETKRFVTFASKPAPLTMLASRLNGTVSTVQPELTDNMFPPAYIGRR